MDEKQKIRVRMAPSPTGPFHIGSARTALFNYLFAKKYNGKFILRIEDTDKERSEKKWENDINDAFEWLGITCDEGPGKGGDFGPYRQSERTGTYRKYIEKLLAENKAYPCFCSEKELEIHRQYLLSQGKPPVYSGKCRDLPQKETKEKLTRNPNAPVIRFRTPNKKISFNDILRGKIEYESGIFGDFVVAKDSQTPLYNLACVIDDYEMQISHVIRGEEHISNTPRQILLAESLAIKTPQYLHLPLILNQQRAKLSKRDPQINAKVLDYKKDGYLAEALVNFIALLGWNPGTDKELFSLQELIGEFSVEKLQKAGAVFNKQKLDWLNGRYIRQLKPEKLTELCAPYLIEAGLIGKNFPFDVLTKIVCLHQERLKTLSEITAMAAFFFQGNLDYDADLLRWNEMTNEEIAEALQKSEKTIYAVAQSDWTKEKLSEILLFEAEKFHQRADGTGDRGWLLWPLRISLSGKKASAPPFEIAEILGKEKTLQRIKKAIEKVKQIRNNI